MDRDTKSSVTDCLTGSKCTSEIEVRLLVWAPMLKWIQYGNLGISGSYILHLDA